MRRPWCSKYSSSRPSSTTRLGVGDVALLHRQDDVVVECLRAALDEQVVGGQTRAADAEALAPDDVLDLVGDALLPLRRGDRLEVDLVRLEHGVASVVLKPADAGAVGEPPRVLERRRRVEQVEPGVRPRELEELLEQPSVVSSVSRNSSSRSPVANARTCSTYARP